MNILLVLSIFLFAAGLMLVLANSRIGRLIHTRSSILGYEDLADILKIAGYGLVFFSLAVVIYRFMHFNRDYFVWIGVGIGILVALINLNNWFTAAGKDRRNKYSGGGAGGYLIGCLGMIILPLLGWLTGYLIKVILT